MFPRLQCQESTVTAGRPSASARASSAELGHRRVAAFDELGEKFGHPAFIAGPPWHYGVRVSETRCSAKKSHLIPRAAYRHRPGRL